MSATLNRLRKARHNQSGFTLIELLIVIVILGVLAAIVVFSVNGIKDRGEASACKANVKTAETAVEAYYAENGSYPATLGALVGTYLKSDPTTGDAAVAVAGYTATGGVVTPGTACD